MKRMAVALVAAWGLSVSLAWAPSAHSAPPVGVGEWESRAPSLTPREEGSFVEVNGRFYLGWGRDRTTQEVYDPATDTWQVVGTLPANLSHVQGAAVNGLIYFVGGFAFDPRRVAILLIGGDKSPDDPKSPNWNRWYDRYVPIADDLYDVYLYELREEGLF